MISPLPLTASDPYRGSRHLVRSFHTEVGGPGYFKLVDIWKIVLPALELVSLSLLTVAIVATDNTEVTSDEYRVYFEFVNDLRSQLRTMTIAFKDGFEFSLLAMRPRLM